MHNCKTRLKYEFLPLSAALPVSKAKGGVSEPSFVRDKGFLAYLEATFDHQEPAWDVPGIQTEGRYPPLSLGTAVDTAGSAAESKSLAKMLLIQHFFGLFHTTDIPVHGSRMSRC